MLTSLKDLSHGHIESSIGSMSVSFLVALPGVIAVGEFDMVRYWLSSDSDSFSGCLWAVSKKMWRFVTT